MTHTIALRTSAIRSMQVVAFCAMIALLTSTIWPQRSYLAQLGYSLCIGLTTQLSMELGARLLMRPGETHWPRGYRSLILIAMGLLCGFFLGGLLGGHFFNLGVGLSSQDSRISILISIAACAIGSYFFYTRSKTAILLAHINATERDAAEARLKLLAAQLEPHMLFNTLANLRALIATDPPRAIAMLDLLDRYLRITLTGSRALSHPLSAEFERLADYLALMAIRMGPRLHYTLDLPDALHDVPMPPLLLQPLVENSIRHGLEPKVEGGEITVRARREGQCIRIDVRDTGMGLDGAPTDPGTGFGVAQVRERLATVYGGEGRLELAAHPEGGTNATLTFPLQIQPQGHP